MINFKTLKVKGFKSFVEPIEIHIENGLTGIVVPILMTKFGWGADVAETVWQTACVLILGQGIADINKK